MSTALRSIPTPAERSARPRSPRSPILVASILLVLALSACTSAPGASSAGSASNDAASNNAASNDAASTSSTPQGPEPGRAPTPGAVAPSRVASLERLVGLAPSRGTLRVTASQADGRVVREQVFYRSGDKRVSGVLSRPRGAGPFPAVLINHGYVSPASYRSGRGFRRETDALVRAGYVTLQTDYRGYGRSDGASAVDRESWVGYTEDAVNAVGVLRRLEVVDRSRIAMLGRSMGGGVTMNVLVTHPGLVSAAVLLSPVSSSFADNLGLFRSRSHRAFVRAVETQAGSRRAVARTYRDLSARTYFDAVTEPVLIQHGTDDEVCPPRWSRETNRLLRAAGVDSTLQTLAGEGHVFDDRYAPSMRSVLRFLRAEV